MNLAVMHSKLVLSLVYLKLFFKAYGEFWISYKKDNILGTCRKVLDRIDFKTVMTKEDFSFILLN